MNIEQLFANDDIELFDLKNDPLEMNNLALVKNEHGEIILAMNNKLNIVIEQEAGEGAGQVPTATKKKELIDW